MQTYSGHVKTYSETPAEPAEVYKVGYSSLHVFYTTVLLSITPRTLFTATEQTRTQILMR